MAIKAEEEIQLTVCRISYGLRMASVRAFRLRSWSHEQQGSFWPNGGKLGVSCHAEIVGIFRGAALAAALSFSPVAEAAQVTLYQQADNGNACNPSCWTSSTTNGVNGFRTFDDFTLAAGGLVERVTWSGFYWNFQDEPSNPVPSSTLNWTISIFADNGGSPGAQLFSQTFAAADVSQTILGSGTMASSTVNRVGFDATFLTGFNATAGTRYWISPLSSQASFVPIFSWSGTSVGGNGVTMQSQDSGAPFSRSNDRVFSLLGQTSGVPEPSIWLLMIAGFGMVGATMRHKSRQRAPATI